MSILGINNLFINQQIRILTTIIHYGVTRVHSVQLISLHFKCQDPPPPPVTGKCMVGAVGHFTLQSMTQTNHKFHCNGGPGVEVKSTVQLTADKGRARGR